MNQRGCGVFRVKSMFNGAEPGFLLHRKMRVSEKNEGAHFHPWFLKRQGYHEKKWLVCESDFRGDA